MIPQNETAWMKVVTTAAAQAGWQWLHIGRVGKHRANGAKGTLGKGWPDLVLVRPGRLVFAELKMDGEWLKAEQAEVMEHLVNASAEYHVWRPSDFAQMMHVLAGVQLDTLDYWKDAVK